jgi:hypothetical protein
VFALLVFFNGLISFYLLWVIVAKDGYPWRFDYILASLLGVFFLGVSSTVFGAGVRALTGSERPG